MVPIFGAEILTFKEDGIWVACWVRKDIVAQGNSESEAFSRLLSMIAYTWIFECMDPNYSPCPVPPKETVEKWKKLHEECHKEMEMKQ